MDATTIYFVRHLAYADMIIVVCFGVPIFLVHLLDGWKLGKIMCTVSAYSFAILPNASLNFTALVGLHRLLRCTIPQKLGCLKKGHTTIIAWVTWFVAVLPGIAKMVHRPKAHFLQYWATCYFDLVNKSHPAALTAVSSVFIAIPSFIMVGSNIALILMSIRLQRAAKEKTGRRTSKGSNKVVYYISIRGFTIVLCPNLHAVFPGLTANGSAWITLSQGPHSKLMVITTPHYHHNSQAGTVDPSQTTQKSNHKTKSNNINPYQYTQAPKPNKKKGP